MIVHAGCLARRMGAGWTAALLLGPSGAGKSDLALRALERGWRLVSDDRTRLWRSGGALYGRAPEPLNGLIEARGLGVLPACPVPHARLVLAVEACEPADLERLPQPATRGFLDVELPVVRLAALEPSAVSKLALAFAAAAAARPGAAPCSP